LDAGSATGQISLEGSSTFTATAATGALGGIVAPTGTGGNPTAAINAITAAVQILGTAQGIVGAGENKLNYAISLATSQITNFSSAQSQIRDANVAQEAANLTQSQVIEQASIAAMAQANQEPQALLKLLQG
jgi:flagellin